MNYFFDTKNVPFNSYKSNLEEGITSGDLIFPKIPTQHQKSQLLTSGSPAHPGYVRDFELTLSELEGDQTIRDVYQSDLKNCSFLVIFMGYITDDFNVLNMYLRAHSVQKNKFIIIQFENKFYCQHIWSDQKFTDFWNLILRDAELEHELLF